MRVLQVPFFFTAYGFSSISGLKLCSSLCNSVFTRAVPKYPLSLRDELQHPEHTSIIRDPYSCDDGEQMTAKMTAREEQALPRNFSHETCIINSYLSTTDTKLFRREHCYEEIEVVTVGKAGICGMCIACFQSGIYQLSKVPSNTC